MLQKNLVIAVEKSFGGLLRSLTFGLIASREEDNYAYYLPQGANGLKTDFSPVATSTPAHGNF